LFFRGGKPAGSKDHKRFYARDGARSTRDWPANLRAQVVESARKRNKTSDFHHKNIRFREKTAIFRVFFPPAPHQNQRLRISRHRPAAAALFLPKLLYNQSII
jgi:hypothetical protein